MSFVSFVRTGELGEKPWKTDAVLRLVASVVICCLFGAVVAAIFQYFGLSHKPALLPFLACVIGASACFAGALFVLARPWPLETYFRNLLILLLTADAGFLLTGFLQHVLPEKNEFDHPTLRLLISVLSFHGAAFFLVYFFLREHHTSWDQAFGFENRPMRTVLIAAVVGYVALWFTWELEIAWASLLERMTFHPHPQETVVMLQSVEGWRNRLATGIATILVAPVVEEILFRGILYTTIKRMGYPRIALWFTALFFALIHANLGTFLPLTFLAIVFIGLYEYTGNLLGSIVAHSLFNAANFIALYHQQI